MSERRILFSAQRNEGPFILEWVAYHKVIGFTDIVVVSNDCTDGSDGLLDDLADEGELEHIRQQVAPGRSPQLSAAEIFMASGLAGRGDWIMWLDLDEYLVVHLGGGNVADLIAAFPDADAIGVNWRVFGTSDVRQWPGEQISENFTRASRPKWMPNTQMKTLFRLSSKIRLMHLHRPVFKAKVSADEIRFYGGDGLRMEDEFIHRMMPRRYPVHRIARERDFHAIGQVNHYMTRTPDLFARKRNRGRGLASDIDRGERHTDEFFEAHDRNDTEDRSILKCLSRKRAEVRRLEALLRARAARRAR